MESKKQIYDLLPKECYPNTILIRECTGLEKIVEKIIESSMYFPLIAKPDIGLRGSGVKKIRNVLELSEYARKANFDFLLQDLIPFKNEVGIFYVRHPHQKEGIITGIVSKEFLIVTGDGVSTIEDLICKTPRFQLQLEVLKEEYGNQLQKILPQGESVNLVPFGNHARGAKFLDGSDWITPQLTATIDEIAKKVPEFYFGRFDIMYNTFEELERGEQFQVVELNGAASNPHTFTIPNTRFGLPGKNWRDTLRICTKSVLKIIKKEFRISIIKWALGNIDCIWRKTVRS